VPAVVGLSVSGWRGRGRDRWEEGEEASGVQVAAVRRRPARAPPRRSARRPGGAVALAVAVSGEIERGWGEVRFFSEQKLCLLFVSLDSEQKPEEAARGSGEAG